MQVPFNAKRLCLHPLSIIAKGLSGSNFNRFNGWLFQKFFHRYEFDGVRIDYPRTRATLKTCGGFLFDAYEVQERELVRRYLDPKATVLELGGCLGFISCLIQQRLDSDQKKLHTVVEMNRQMIEFLHRNRELNAAHYQVVHGVVTSQTEVKAELNPGEFHSSKLVAGDSSATTVGHVPTLTYSQLPHATEYDTWVMDIEGAEVAFIQENRNRLPGIRSIIMETHPAIVSEADLQATNRLLSDSGFRLAEALGVVQVWQKPTVTG